MARNRKRAKERRARRPQAVASGRAEREDAAPGPVVHAAPDVELAEAQLALGRPDIATEGQGEPDGGRPEVDDAPELHEALEADEELELEPAGADGGPDAASTASELDGEDLPGSGGELAAHGATLAERRPVPGNRLVTFLQGSWHELQRVQWPDRRQTMQATAVVIGFVIVAGVFLGVADALAAKIMNYILK